MSLVKLVLIKNGGFRVKKKITALSIILMTLIVGLIGVLAGCNMYSKQTVSRAAFIEDDLYDRDELIINAGDAREFQLLNSDGIAFSDKDHKAFTFELDNVNTLHETGGIKIEGRKFIVPAETLDIKARVNVIYDNEIILNATVIVKNLSIAAEKAREAYALYVKDFGVIVQVINSYRYALESGDEYIKEYEDAILKVEEKLANPDITESEKVDQEMYLGWYIENIADMEYKMETAPAYLEANMPKYFEYLAERNALFLLYHQPIKGGAK